MRSLFTWTLVVVLGSLTTVLGLSVYHPNPKVAGAETDLANQSIVGLILPHHELAREYIIKAVEAVSSRHQYRTIVVLSPNHFRPQSYAFSTGRVVKDYPIATELVNQLSALDAQLVVDDQLASNDHGLFVPMSYLHHYFPQAQFVPLLFSPNFSLNQLEKFAKNLVLNLPSDTLYVASVDFSHNNMPLAAARYNAESITTIHSFDYAELLSYSDEHMDSPGAIGTLLKVMNLTGSYSWETWFNSHGSLLTDNPLLQGTSYVIGVFRRP